MRRYKQASRRAGELETELNDKASNEANVMTENIDLKTRMTQLSVTNSFALRCFEGVKCL